MGEITMVLDKEKKRDIISCIRVLLMDFIKAITVDIKVEIDHL